MIYNSILDVCSIIFVPNLAFHSLEFDQNLCCCYANFTKTSHIFHIVCMALTLHDLQLHVRLVRSHPNGDLWILYLFIFQKGSHVYFLLQVFWVILLFCQIELLFDVNVALRLPWWPDVTIVQSDITIIVPWQLSTGSKHDYLFCYCPLVGILFEVLRIRLLNLRQSVQAMHIICF